jgi:hypothetical protein
LEPDNKGSIAGKKPSPALFLERTSDADRWENVWTAAGSVKSSAGT